MSKLSGSTQRSGWLSLASPFIALSSFHNAAHSSWLLKMNHCCFFKKAYISSACYKSSLLQAVYILIYSCCLMPFQTFLSMYDDTIRFALYFFVDVHMDCFSHEESIVILILLSICL